MNYIIKTCLVSAASAILLYKTSIACFSFCRSAYDSLSAEQPIYVRLGNLSEHSVTIDTFLKQDSLLIIDPNHYPELASCKIRSFTLAVIHADTGVTLFNIDGPVINKTIKDEIRKLKGIHKIYIDDIIVLVPSPGGQKKRQFGSLKYTIL